jgi:competence protein ComEC
MRVFRRNPLFAPLLAVMAGLAAEYALPGEPIHYVVCLALAPLALWAWRVSRAAALPAAGPAALSRRHSILCLLGLSACALGAGWWLSLHPLPDTPDTNIAPGQQAIVEGCVVSAVRTLPEQTRFVLQIPSGERMQVSVYPRPGELLPRLAYGRTVQVQGRVRLPRNFGNPGSFDYERYLRRQGILWLASVTGAAHIRLQDDQSQDKACANRALAWVHAARSELLQRLANRFPPDDFAAAYIPAILFGEDQFLPESTLDAFRRAGVYHTLVISGQHVAILATFSLLVLQLLPLPRWTRFLLTALACWAYALLSGYETPAVRAACGITLYLAGSLAYRRARPVNLLSAVALLFLVWDPGLLFDTGFQLSFGAVLVIAGIAAPLQRHWFGHWPKVARDLGNVASDLRLPPAVAQARVELRLLAGTLSLATRLPVSLCQRMLATATLVTGGVASLLLISAVVQWGLSPLLIESFHQAPLVGPLANLAVSPLLGLMVPLAFLDLALQPPWLQHALSGLAELTRQITGLAAHVNPDWRVPNAPGWLLTLCAAWIVAGIVRCEPLLAKPPRMPRPVRFVHPGQASPSRQPRMLRWVGRTATVAAVLTWLLLFVHPFAPQFTRGSLELTMIDVGQGESLLLVTPNGRTILVDAGGLGGFSSTSRLDTGEDVVGPLLWSRGIRRLDLLVLSHFDFDHAGGAMAILRAFRPRALWTPGPADGHPLGESLVAEAARLGVPVLRKLRGDHEAIDGVEFRVLHPGMWYPTRQNSNRGSMVLHLRYAGATALLTGDLERGGELQLVAEQLPLQAQLLKVPHHGSRTSSSAVFLDAVQPSLAVVSVGYLNPFRHPHASVVERFQKRGAALWRTDQEGAITLRSDGLHWRREWLDRLR